MILGIDCRHLSIKYKEGINTYTFGLIEGFNKFQTPNSFVIFVNKGQKKEFKKLLKNNFKIMEIGNSTGFIRKALLFIPFVLNSINLWKILNNFYYNISGINNFLEKNCDVLYTPTTVLNTYNLAIPTIVSMHDIQQFHFPNFFSKKELKLRNLKFSCTVKTVNYIQASSEFIKQDLLKHYNSLRKEQIIVINEGVNIEKFKKTKIKNFNFKYKLPKNYLFYPAQTWPHKNHITVLKALKILKEENLLIPLVMCGSKKSSHNEILLFIHNNNLENVHHLGVVSEDELVYLYKKAKLFITAVLYESSSLPILEAAASGINIIASKTPPNIEYSLNLKIDLFDPLDSVSLAELLRKLFSKENIKKNEKVVINNNQKIFKFSWIKVAEKYNYFLEKIINKKD